MNEYDKAGRYLIKRNPPGFFRWLLRRPAENKEDAAHSRPDAVSGRLKGAIGGLDMTKLRYLEEFMEAYTQAWAEGWAEGKREMLHYVVLSTGRRRFGKAASRKQKAQLHAITDLARLERIRDRLLDAESWDDLLATP